MFDLGGAATSLSPSGSSGEPSLPRMVSPVGPDTRHVYGYDASTWQQQKHQQQQQLRASSGIGHVTWVALACALVYP